MERSNIPYKTCNVIYKPRNSLGLLIFPIAKAISNEDAIEQFVNLTGIDSERVVRVEPAA